MQLWELAAREGIRDTISRYTWCGEFMDAAGFADCFTADAMLEIKDGETFRGREGVLSMLAGVRDRTRATVEPTASAAPVVMRHHVSSSRIELEGKDRARAFSYFAVFLPPHGHDHWGRYADELVREGERWRFRRRRVSVDGAVQASRMWPLK
jgi:SnoaL-like domain